MSRIKRETIEEQGVISHKDMSEIRLNFFPAEGCGKGQSKKERECRLRADKKAEKAAEKAAAKKRARDEKAAAKKKAREDAKRAKEDAKRAKEKRKSDTALAKAAEKAQQHKEDLLHDQLNKEYIEKLHAYGAANIIKKYGMKRSGLAKSANGKISFALIAKQFETIAKTFKEAQDWLHEKPAGEKRSNIQILGGSYMIDDLFDIFQK